MHEGSPAFTTDEMIPDIHTHEPYQESAVEEPNNSNGIFEEDQNGLTADGDHDSNPTLETTSPTQRGLHPTVDVFADEASDDAEDDPAPREPAVQPEQVKEALVDNTADENAVEPINSAGGEPQRSGAGLAPAEPTGMPSSLTTRQKHRLQQLFETGEITRLDGGETDEMVWKRYRTRMKES